MHPQPPSLWPRSLTLLCVTTLLYRRNCAGGNEVLADGQREGDRGQRGPVLVSVGEGRRSPSKLAMLSL